MNKMDDYDPVDDGMEGIIYKIDDIGTLHVIWDDGRRMGVIPNVDEYEILPYEDTAFGFGVFESGGSSEIKKIGSPVLSPSKSTPGGKKVSQNIKSSLSKSKVKLESEEELEETMTAGGGGGLAGAAGYSYTAPLGTTKKTNENKIIKVKDLMKEETTTSSLTATVDFVVANLLGWGTIEDMSPPWPSPTKKAENNELEDWWWQKIPTYNGGVITDPYAKTNDVWNDDQLDSNVNNDMTQFQKDVYKNLKKYKQSVITTDKGFDLNIDPPHKDWKFSLQKGINLKNDSKDYEIQTFRNRHYSRTLKKEDIPNFVDNLISEAKEKDDTVHTKKWDRCVKAVEMRNKKNGTDYKPEAVCTDSIGYEGSIKKSHRKKEVSEEDVNETTTFGSVFGGGFPVGPAFAAKNGKWTPSKKPVWKGGKIVQKLSNTGILGENTLFNEINKIKFVPTGGKFVKIKDKCAKYNNQPWCSQGAIDKPLELSNETFENIKKASKKTGLPFNVILENINKKLLEDFGRNYTIESLYDVIKDELMSDPKIEDWMMLMDSPIGGVENFEMPHHRSDYGSTEGITDDGDSMGIKGPHGILAMVILPKLVKMGILTGNLKDKNELGILNTISELLYHDIKPYGFNDVNHGDDDLQMTENTIKTISKLSKKLGISENIILDKIKLKILNKK
jgi:hypothetical protein